MATKICFVVMGFGEPEKLEQESKRIFASTPTEWMPDSSREQLDKMKDLL